MLNFPVDAFDQYVVHWPCDKSLRLRLADGIVKKKRREKRRGKKTSPMTFRRGFWLIAHAALVCPELFLLQSLPETTHLRTAIIESTEANSSFFPCLLESLHHVQRWMIQRYCCRDVSLYSVDKIEEGEKKKTERKVNVAEDRVTTSRQDLQYPSISVAEEADAGSKRPFPPLSISNVSSIHDCFALSIALLSFRHSLSPAQKRREARPSSPRNSNLRNV